MGRIVAATLFFLSMSPPRHPENRIWLRHHGALSGATRKGALLETTPRGRPPLRLVARPSALFFRSGRVVVTPAILRANSHPMALSACPPPSSTVESLGAGRSVAQARGDRPGARADGLRSPWPRLPGGVVMAAGVARAPSIQGRRLSSHVCVCVCV